MRRFFLVSTFFFLLGICLPIWAANTGGEKHACTDGETGSMVDPNHHCQDTASSHGKVIDQKAPPDSSANASEKRENTIIYSEQSKDSSVVKPEKKKEASGNVLSFNFLYYLFYKFSLSEFF